jgi:hypothetical protein
VPNSACPTLASCTPFLSPILPTSGDWTGTSTCQWNPSKAPMKKERRSNNRISMIERMMRAEGASLIGDRSWYPSPIGQGRRASASANMMRGGRRWILCILALSGLSGTVHVEAFSVAGGPGRVGLFEMTHFSRAASCAGTGTGRVIPSLRAGRYDKEGTACGGIQMMGSKLPRRYAACIVPDMVPTASDFWSTASGAGGKDLRGQGGILGRPATIPRHHR